MTRKLRLFAYTFAVSFLFITACYEEKPVSSDGSNSQTVSLTPEWQSPLPQSNPLNSVWVEENSGTVYLVGDFGTLITINGSNVTLEDVDQSTALTAVWGNSQNDIWVCGNAGLMLHFDGESWTEVESGTSTTLTSIFGTAEDDIYAVGRNGTIIHYDGTEWSEVEFDAPRDLFGIWGSSSDYYYAVGDQGLIVHFDGTAWDTTNTITTRSLTAVWGIADTVIAVGQQGKVIINNGNSPNEWTADDIETDFSFSSVWGDSPANLFVTSVGGRVYQRTINGWISPFPGVEELRDIHGPSPDEFYFCGDNGIVYRVDGGDLVTRVLPRLVSNRLRAIDGLTGNRVFAGGDRGTFVTRQFSGWQGMLYGAQDTIRDIWAAHDNAVYAVAQNKILRYDGHYWKTMFTDTDSLANFVSIWGRSTSDIWAAGDYGIVQHWDGMSWNRVQTPDDRFISAIRGDYAGNIYTAGEGGTIRKYDGAGWTTLYERSDFYHLGLRVYSSKNIVAVGVGGYVVRYDGSSWNVATRLTANDLLDVWGYEPNELFAVGRNGAILYFNGDYWTALASNTGNDLYGIWGADADSFYAVGDAGTIIRYRISTTD